MNTLTKRKTEIDIVKTLLIIFVIIGHYDNSIIHTIIYWFHMPVFFILSGYTANYKEINAKYLKTICKKQYIPFLLWSFVIFVLFYRNNTLTIIIKVAWGGRLLPGVFWFTNCYIVSMVLFQLILKRYHNSNKLFWITGVLFLISTIESIIVQHYGIANLILMPWAVDISFIAITYIVIGYALKSCITSFSTDKNRLYDKISLLLLAVIIGFIMIQIKGIVPLYIFDMKQLNYTNPLLSILIPICFAAVLLRVAHYISYNKILRTIMEYIGQNTLPIMYLHLPLLEKLSKKIELNRLEFLIIGLLVPLLVDFFIKLFGKVIYKKERGERI